MTKVDEIREKIEQFKRKVIMTTAIVGATVGGGMVKDAQQKEGKFQDRIETVARAKPKKYDAVKEKYSYLMPILLSIEGCTKNAYTDDIGVWTYGIGCTVTKDGEKVKEGDTLKSNEEAYEVAKYHIEERIDSTFNYIDRKLSPSKEAAVTSFAFNLGAGVLLKDGQLTELGQAINEGNDKFVVEEFLKYNKAGGSFMRGLFFRRVLEAYVYQGFISKEDLQKCYIGGIGNVSVNKYMNEAFKLEVKKIGRRKKKIVATFDESAVFDRAVAKQLIAICQTPMNVPQTSKMSDFNFGERVYKLMPNDLLAKSVLKQKRNEVQIAYVGKVLRKGASRGS